MTPPVSRALLIGAPLEGLGEVEQSVDCLATHLSRRGFSAIETIVGPTATMQGVEDGLTRLEAEARPGDRVIFYFAGHGTNAWDPSYPAEIYPVLLPMDARQSTPQDLRVLIGHELERRFRALSQQISDSAGRSNLTVILECCYSAGLLRQIELDPEARERARTIIAGSVGALRTRRETTVAERSPAAQIVRVVAADRFERAYGSAISTVGATTRAMVRLIEAHPHEPWQTIEHRLRAELSSTQPQQWPGIEGNRQRVPWTTIERPLPDGTLPCRETDSGHWRCVLGPALAGQPGGLYSVGPSPFVPSDSLARLSEDQTTFVPLIPGASSGGSVAWALPSQLGAGTTVWLHSDGRPPLSDALRKALHREDVRLPSVQRGTQPPGDSILLTRDARGLALRDQWGDTVVQWSREPRAPQLLRWLGRLAELNRWMTSEAQPPAATEHAYTLQLSIRAAPTEPWMPWSERATIGSGDSAQVELRCTDCPPHLYLSAFRVTTKRAIEHLTEESAGGFPSSINSPAIIHVPLTDTGPQWQALVLIVADHPLPMHWMARAPIRVGDEAPSPMVHLIVKRFRLA